MLGTFFIGVAIATTTPNTVHIEAPVSQETVISPIPVELHYVGFCESGNRQFNEDGTVLRGVINSQDVGKYQINEYYHLEESKRLGYDIYTEEGNTDYAIYLYETQGLQPWVWSKPCWSEYIKTPRKEVF